MSLFEKLGFVPSVGGDGFAAPSGCPECHDGKCYYCLRLEGGEVVRPLQAILPEGLGWVQMTEVNAAAAAGLVGCRVAFDPSAQERCHERLPEE